MILFCVIWWLVRSYKKGIQTCWHSSWKQHQPLHLALVWCIYGEHNEDTSPITGRGWMSTGTVGVQPCTCLYLWVEGVHINTLYFCWTIDIRYLWSKLGSSYMVVADLGQLFSFMPAGCTQNYQLRYVTIILHSIFKIRYTIERVLYLH